MDVIEKIKDYIEEWLSPPDYEAVRWHLGDYNEISSIANSFDGYLTRIRPYRKSDGIKEAEELISTLYDPSVQRSWLRDLLRLSTPPDEHSFEMWFSEGKLRFIMKSPNEDEARELRKTIGGIYPHAEVSNSRRHMPKIPEGSFVAGGEFELKYTKYAPLRSFSGPDPFEVEKVEASDQIGSVLVDPYKTITSELVGHQSEAVLFQMVFSPVPSDWTEGYGPRDPSAERKAEYLKEGRYVDSLKNPRIIDPTPKDLRTAEHITDLEASQAFDVNMRYFVWDQTERGAVRHAKAIENIFTTVYQNNEVAQQLEAVKYQAKEVKDRVYDAARRHINRKGVILTKEEVAAIGHFPNDTINTSNVDFVESVFGEKAPGESATADKEDITDKGSANISQQYAEVKEHNPELADGFDDGGEGLTVYEKAKRLVENTNDAYYRSDIQPEEYPETSVTKGMPSNSKKYFKEFTAMFERGEIGYDHFYNKVDDDEKAEEIINDVETHIDEAYLIDARQKSIENGKESSSRFSLKDNPDDLPTTPEAIAEEVAKDVEECRSSDSTTQPTESDETLPTHQQKHPIKFINTNYAQSRKKNGDVVTMNFTQEDVNNNLYLGEDSRKLFIEKHAERPDDDIWIGYQNEGDSSVREVGVPKSAWFQHMSIFGTTGKGKSTLMKNMALQVAHKGHGFVMIDPKGDMSKELVEELPEDRLDDIIWIEPGSIEHNKIAAINFLQTSVPKDHPRYDREVESIVNDLQAVLRAGEYWGPKMAGITKNITRAMVRSENPYTIYDMYNVLIREEKRWNFARSLQREDVDLGESASGDISEDVKQYSRRIAEMDDEEVDPVVRRLQDWAESPISKEIVSHRYSSVNIDEAVNEGKIILLKNSVEDTEIKRVISTAIMRRVWVAIQARAEITEEEDREPFFAFIDEFDDVVSEDMSIDKMLTKARSGRMSVTVAMQNPSQIKNNHENVLKQIFNNTKTMISFGVLDPDDGYLISKRMGEEFDSDDMTSMPDYRVITRVSYIGENGPQISQPLGLRTFPDYPPLRTKSQAKDAIEQSLDRYGVLPMDNYPGETDLLISGGGLQEQTVVNFLELVWNEHHRSRSEIISVEDIADQFEDVVGERLENYPNGIAVPEELIEVHNVNFDEEDDSDDGYFNEPEHFADKPGGSGSSPEDIEDDTDDKIAYKSDGRIYIQKNDAQVSITAHGIDAILQQDSGRSQPTESHREIIRESFRWFSRLGFHAHVPVQVGSMQVCDARANIPISGDLSIGELQDALKRFEEEYPLAAEISGSNNMNLEAEGTTQRKPARTIENVLRAKRKGKDVVLIVKDGRSDGHGRDYHANRVENILSDPPYYREDRRYPPGVDPSQLDEDEEDMEPVRHLYNKAEKLRVGNPDENQEKFALIPKGSQTVWIDNGEKLLLFDGRGVDATKQGSVKYSETEYASSNAMNIWCRYDNYQKEWVVYPGGNKQFRYESKTEMEKDYQFVYAPLYMQNEVDELPETDSWKIVILPDPDAITTDPKAPQEDPEQIPIEEKYKLDFCFPPEEVPLLHEDGSTEPLIPEKYDDLLTESRAEYEDLETDDGDEVEPDAEHATTNNSQELTMDAIEQIQMEEQVKDIIDGYKKTLSREEKKRIQEIEEVFGAKNPTEIEFWRDIWDNFERDYNTGIPESVLPDAIRGATGLVSKKAKDAVSIGKDFDLLVEDEPAEPLEFDLGDNDSIIRLVIPEERPDLYIGEPERFADKRKWEALWEYAFAEPDEALGKVELANGARAKFDLDNRMEGEAAVAVANLSGAIEPVDGGYKLGPERPDDLWVSVWRNVDTELTQPLKAQKIYRGMLFETEYDRETIMDVFEDALEHNELYSPDHVDDDHYLINDPSTDKGPEIKEREEPRFPDDSDNSDDTDPDDGGEGARTDDSPEEQEPSTETTAEQSSSDDGAGGSDSRGDETESGPEPATTEAAQSPAEPSATTDDQSLSSDTTTPATAGADIEDRISDGGIIEEDAFIEIVEENPPDRDKVLSAFADAIEFFHSQIDNPIESNIQWNKDNPNARQTMPETAREYFQHPRYDDTPDEELIKFINPKEVEIEPDDFAENLINIDESTRKAFGDALTNQDERPVMHMVPQENDDDTAGTLLPYSFQMRQNRGWCPEIISDKKLGWAPEDPHALYEHLREKGHTDAVLLASGLFYTDDRPGPLTAHFKGRYVFPYFNSDGEPVYAISRSIDADRDSYKRIDNTVNQKYTKAIKNPGYSMIDEPIYGIESVKEGQPLLITEGMADAISAHERNIPCISPVTRKFKTEHVDVLKEIILENNVPRVYIVQDADPPLVHDKEQEDGVEYEEISDILKVGQYGSGMDGAVDTARYLDAIALEESEPNAADTDGVVGESERGDGDESADGSESGTESDEPAWKQDLDEDATELEEAHAWHTWAAEENLDRAFETYIIPLPRFGGLKYDLDDYLTDKFGTITPPALWAANNTIEGCENNEWASKLHDNRDFRYFTADQYEDLDEGNFDGDHPLPGATILNMLPTLAPRNIPPEAGSGKGASTPHARDRPDKDWNSGDNLGDDRLFNLTMFEVFGLSEGYRGTSPLGHIGESENYFCVLDDDGAYCHKRDAWYNPATAILCIEGERPADNPYGSMSAEEKFTLWEHVRENRIKRAQLPNDAFVWYALDRNIATEDDLVTLTGTYGEFEGLRGRKYHETVDHLVEEYDFDIVRDLKRNQGDEDDENNPESEAETSSESAPDTEDNYDESSDLIDETDQSAMNPEGGVDMTSYFEDDDDESDADPDQSEVESTEDADESGDDEDDELTRFRTYEEPEDTGDDFDVDREAVKQFVDEFGEVGEPEDKQMKTPSDDLLILTTKWAKINNIQLDNLSQSTHENTRKGHLKNIMDEEFDVEKRRLRYNGKKQPVFRPIILSEEIWELENK